MLLIYKCINHYPNSQTLSVDRTRRNDKFVRNCLAKEFGISLKYLLFLGFTFNEVLSSHYQIFLMHIILYIINDDDNWQVSHSKLLSLGCSRGKVQLGFFQFRYQSACVLSRSNENRPKHRDSPHCILFRC